ncbi:hypothetical protein H8959_011625 [Pygathrix nigripes]
MGEGAVTGKGEQEVIKQKGTQRAKASQPKSSRLPPTGNKVWMLGSPPQAWKNEICRQVEDEQGLERICFCPVPLARTRSHGTLTTSKEDHEEGLWKMSEY